MFYLLILFLTLNSDIIVVNNYTNVQHIDIMVKTASHVIGLHSGEISVAPLNDKMKTLFSKKNNHNLSAHVVKNPTSYTIFIDVNLPLEEFILVLAHEMVHIKQMKDGKLKYNTNGTVTWKNKVSKLNVDYNQREWEKEAIKYQVFVAQKIHEKLD